MDPPEPVPGAGDGMSLDDLTPETIDALVAVAGPGSGSPLLSVEFRQLGGAVAADSPEPRRASGAIDAGFASLRRRHGRRRPRCGPPIEARVAASRQGPPSTLWAAERRLLQLRRPPAGRRVPLPAGHPSRPAVGEGGLRPGRALPGHPPHPARRATLVASLLPRPERPAAPAGLSTTLPACA